jgi:thiol-disulfide isomerase/thioredoxin
MMLWFAALKVLILAGGIDAQQNHDSHKAHVDRMLSLLSARGVPADDIAIFWADGTDPKPDRAVRTRGWPDGWWLVANTRIGDEIEPESETRNTTFPLPVQPAEHARLRAWLGTVGPTLGADDTLLIAVTDHGAPDEEDGNNTGINLWGEAVWDTRTLLADLAPVPEETRVMLWMSQCYSGGFADLYRHRTNLCGSFAANPDRVAYGCYSDLAKKDDVGHFHRLLSAFERHADLASATDEVMVRDDTPDTPHLTSDALLFDALSAHAELSGTPVDLVIDARAHRAPQDDPAHAMIAQISMQYGLGVLDGYGAAIGLVDLLAASQFGLDAWGDRWSHADEAHRGRFIEGPARRSNTLKPPKTEAGKVKAQQRLAKAAKAAFDRLEKPAQTRIRALRNKARAVRRVNRRADLQTAAALRVAYLYARLAGPAVLDRATEREYARLRACETTPLLPLDTPAEPAKPQAPVPQLAQQLPAQVDGLRPGFLGIAFQDLPGFKGIKVRSLQPGSPAAASGLQPGDRLLTMNGTSIQGKGDFAERVLLARPGSFIEFTGRRGRAPLTEKVRVVGLPMPMPAPAVGEMVPPLRLSPYDAHRPLPAIGEGHPTVLFFWATWCKPCKRALPDLKAYAAEHGASIIAVTDEDARTVRRFLKKSTFELPIALDAAGEARRLFSLDKRPAFAVVAPNRQLLQFAVGYDDALPIDPPVKAP